jgi:large subunit ribosomal protein L3
MKGILGRKVGMTQVFTVDGTLIPVTVIEVKPNVVLQKKTKETDGYEALQLGYEDVKEHRATKAAIGHAKKANTAPKKYIREVPADEMNYNVGDEIKADLFAAGDVVDVQGTSKGHGYSGVIVRNNGHMMPKSHGASRNKRHVGSLATNGRNNGVINKGAPMPGQEGVYTTTNQNLVVIKVSTDDNYIMVRGNVPGPKRGLVYIHTTVKPVKKVAVEELVSYAGGSVQEELNKVAEAINEEQSEKAAAAAAIEEAKKKAASAARKK